ncbi:MAG TPA: glycoside hydrolase family 15 protein [Xanthobacteraceae bacterium]|nr:glycoside hydrolase family 15 protein [Xanthobacteraceae bacterium]
MPLPIEDYALIGDCESAALVGRDGSVDWLCWPRFDSDACFAALLGEPKNGRWLIAPKAEHAKITRCYRKDTLILETCFETETGAVTLVDFMPLRDGYSNLVRIIIGERGEVRMRNELIIRFGYGATIPWVTRLSGGGMRAISGPDMLVLDAPVRLRGEDFKTVGEFTVTAGEKLPFVLTYGPSHLDPPKPVEPWKALARTEKFWTEWAGRCQPSRPWHDAVVRSLITLKALTYGPTGGIVAAPTTSLPEQLGGPRNWDYRFCWLRDATLTLLATMDAGYYEEAREWRDWLARATAGTPAQMQIMYGIAGEHRLTEWEVPWLSGYEGAKPVRIGNAAHNQLQLDVYGEVMDALHQARRGGLQASEHAWDLQRAVMEHVEKIWREPDEGIWEVRGPRRHFTYSKVMCWVAFDRMIKSAEEFGLPGPVERWKKLRAEIHDDVCANGFDRDLGSFVQSYGSKELDASLLLLPAVGFLPPQEPRMRGTVAAVERTLMVDGFVLRYDTARTDDGLPPGEGAFLACSFWLADAYVLQGRMDEAQRLFERLLTLRNDLGLLSQEYYPRARRLVGNFPQAFSHVALVNTAANLGRAIKPAEQRSDRTVASA